MELLSSVICHVSEDPCERGEEGKKEREIGAQRSRKREMGGGKERGK